MMLGMLSVVPGLGEIAAAADMALYIYQGDYTNAALAATMFVPGGAVLALGAGAKGLRELSTFARAGAKDLGAAVEGSRVLRGLDRAGQTVHEVVSAAKAKVSGWVRGGEKAASDLADVDQWRVSGSVPESGRTISSGYTQAQLRGIVGEEAQGVADRGLGRIDSQITSAQWGAVGKERWRIWQYRGSIVHEETLAALQHRLGRDFVTYSSNNGIDFTFGGIHQIELTAAGSVGRHTRAPRSIPIDQIATYSWVK